MSLELNWILRDIDNALYYNAMAPFSLEWKDWIQKQVNEQFGIIKSKKSTWKPHMQKAIQQQIDSSKGFIIYSRKVDFIFVMIEIIALFYKKHFDYRLYAYCEQRLRHKTNERDFLFHCIDNVHHKLLSKSKDIYNNILSYKLERCILSELFLCDFPEKYSIYDLNRMLLNIKNAYESQQKLLQSNFEKELLTAYVAMLAKEIRTQWDKLFK